MCPHCEATVKKALEALDGVKEAQVSHTALCEKETYDVAAVRIAMQDQNGNVLPFYQGSVKASMEGPAELIGPSDIMLRGGYGGTYVRSVGTSGTAVLKLQPQDMDPVQITFTIEAGGDE